jgi:hypothetical protein
MLSVSNKPIMLSVFKLSVVMLSVFKLSVFKLSVVMLSVVMLNVVVPIDTASITAIKSFIVQASGQLIHAVCAYIFIDC